MGRYLLISTLGEAKEALTHTRQTKYPPLQRKFTRESVNLQHEITRFPLHSCNFVPLHCARVWRVHNARVRIKCVKRLWVGSNGNSRRTVGKGWKINVVICKLRHEWESVKCGITYSLLFALEKCRYEHCNFASGQHSCRSKKKKGLSDTTEALQLKRKSFPN